MPRQPNGAGPGEFLYTPELTATTTDPDLGTGGSATGGWAAAPFTWAAGDQINVTGLYQVL